MFYTHDTKIRASVTSDISISEWCQELLHLHESAHHHKEEKKHFWTTFKSNDRRKKLFVASLFSKFHDVLHPDHKNLKTTCCSSPARSAAILYTLCICTSCCLLRNVNIISKNLSSLSGSVKCLGVSHFIKYC